MRKPELTAAIAAKAEVSKDKAAQILNIILTEITTSVARGEEVSLVGFGSFNVRQRAARMGMNPQTKKPLEIPASRIVSFRAGKNLKDAVA